MKSSYRALRPSANRKRPPSLHSNVTKRHVALLACEECRRKRTKCSGQRPACSNCAGKGLECAYRNRPPLSNEAASEAIVKVVHMLGQVPSSELIQLINNTKDEHSSEKILAAITDAVARQTPATGDGNSAVESTDAAWSKELVGWGAIASTHEAVKATALSPLAAHQHPGVPVTQDAQELPLHAPVSASSSQTWSCITDNIKLTNHLLALYFCWEYPSFAPLSKEHFIQDFSDRRHRYCSPMLVNAILALGCHLSERRNLHADAFFAESQRLFSSATSHHSLTTVQSLVIMSIREARCGRGIESQHYAKLGMILAIEMGLHNIAPETDSNEIAVQSKTFWGAFTLHQTWCLMTGTVPQCTRYLKRPAKPAIPVDIETSTWIPYVDGDDHLLPFIQLSNVRSIYQCFCELCELVHQSLHCSYPPRKLLTAEALLRQYHHYLNWYDQLPQALKLGYNSTPAVLLTHLYYHFAVLLLFRRFIKLCVVGSETLPYQVCAQSADTIRNLIISYSNLYTLKRTSSIFPYILFAAATTHIAVSAARFRVDLSGSVLDAPPVVADNGVREALKQNIEALCDIAPYHEFGNQALHQLRGLAYKWGVKTRLDYDTNSRRSWMTAGAEIAGCQSPEDVGTTEEAKSNMNKLLPQLFWLQDEPSVLDTREIEQRGFARL